MGISPLITTATEGLCEALDEARIPSKLKPIKEEFYAWANAAILKSFESTAIQKLYSAYNPDGKPFSIFVAKHARGLSESRLEALWTNRTGPTPNEVKKKQTKARKGKKYKTVRKKTPAELRAEGRLKVAKKTTTKNATKKKR